MAVTTALEIDLLPTFRVDVVHRVIDRCRCNGRFRKKWAGPGQDWPVSV